MLRNLLYFRVIYADFVLVKTILKLTTEAPRKPFVKTVLIHSMRTKSSIVSATDVVSIMLILAFLGVSVPRWLISIWS